MKAEPTYRRFLKMFSKAALVAITAFAAVAVAGKYNSTNDFTGQCQTGTQQCCNQVQTANDPQVAQALAAIPVQVAADILVGLTCSPISALGIAGNSWLVLETLSSLPGVDSDRSLPSIALSSPFAAMTSTKLVSLPSVALPSTPIFEIPIERLLVLMAVKWRAGESVMLVTTPIDSIDS